MVLAEQRATEIDVLGRAVREAENPKMFHLRRDPFERADENTTLLRLDDKDHAYMLYEMQAIVGAQIDNFVKYPPRHKAASFNLDEVMRKLQEALSSKDH